MKLDISPMLNAYPDSMGGTLHDIVELLARPEFENVFGSFYILPSVFNTDLDRGFSVIDYTLNRELAGPQDMEGLKALGLKLKLDFNVEYCGNTTVSNPDGTTLARLCTSEESYTRVVLKKECLEKAKETIPWRLMRREEVYNKI